MRLRTLLSLAAVAAFAAGLARGATQKLNLKTGGSIVGEVVRTEDGYKVTIRPGQTMVIPADQVESIEDVVTPETEYQQRLAGIDAKDPKARYDLGQWAFREGHLKIARKELQESLKLRPDFEMAKLLLQAVEEKIAEAEADGDDRAGGKGEPRVTEKILKELMTEKDINRIRLMELDEADKVVVRFRNDVVKRFIEAWRGRDEFAGRNYERVFRGYDNTRKARYILRKVDRDNWAMKDDVQVTTDPQFMLDFRTKVWPILARTCGSSDCHGGKDPGGRLKLYRLVGPRDRINYTNFYVLSVLSRGGLDLMDRDHPSKSLLLEYGLPREIAEFPHPVEIPFAFRDRSDPKYVLVHEWIDSLRKPPLHRYPVSYRPLWQKAAPTTAPAWPPAPASAPTTRPAADQ